MPDESSPAEPRLVARHRWISLYAGHYDQPFVACKHGVLIIPMNYAGEILFIREPSIFSSDMMLTLPGGGIDDGETPAEAANRELQEEVGFRAGVLFPVGVLAPLGRYGDWNIHLFFARNLNPSRRVGDEIYQIEIERVPFDDFERLIERSQLDDAVAIAGLYMARSFVEGKLTVDRKP